MKDDFDNIAVEIPALNFFNDTYADYNEIGKYINIFTQGCINDMCKRMIVYKRAFFTLVWGLMLVYYNDTNNVLFRYYTSLQLYI